jgi:hypothetical protein
VKTVFIIFVKTCSLKKKKDRFKTKSCLVNLLFTWGHGASVKQRLWTLVALTSLHVFPTISASSSVVLLSSSFLSSLSCCLDLGDLNSKRVSRWQGNPSSVNCPIYFHFCPLISTASGFSCARLCRSSFEETLGHKILKIFLRLLPINVCMSVLILCITFQHILPVSSLPLSKLS